MLAKNARASVATVAVALITGLMVALWVALMPAPAQAQTVDELQLLKLKAKDLEDPDWHSFLDPEDEVAITVDGINMGHWEHIKPNRIVNLGGVSTPISGGSAEIQLIETGGNQVLLGTLEVAYTDGTPKTDTITYEFRLPNGIYISASYDLTYVVKQPSPGPTDPGSGPTDPGSGPTDPGSGPTDPGSGGSTDTPPTIDPIKPAPGSKIHNRRPLIVAKVSDAPTDLAQSNIKLFVDGKPITNFSYDAARDRLSYRSGKLAYGGHKVKVKVEATDASGLKGKKTWRFKVVRR